MTLGTKEDPPQEITVSLGLVGYGCTAYYATREPFRVPLPGAG